MYRFPSKYSLDVEALHVYLSGITLPQAPSSAAGVYMQGPGGASGIRIVRAWAHSFACVAHRVTAATGQRRARGRLPRTALLVGSNHVWQTGPCGHRWVSLHASNGMGRTFVFPQCRLDRHNHGHNRSSFRTNKVPFRCAEPSLDVAPDPIRHHLHC
jgi:hypothetical protein